MNLVVLQGNISKDSELRYTPNGKAVVRFSVAVNEGYGDKKKTQFFNITSFGAEKLCEYLIKGTKVLIKGKLNNSSYEKDEVKHYKTDIIADNYGGIELLSSKNNTKDTSKYERENQAMNDVFGAGDYQEDITPVYGENMPF